MIVDTSVVELSSFCSSTVSPVGSKGADTPTTVPKLDVLNALELALSEKQIPQFVENSESENGECRESRRGSRSEGRCVLPACQHRLLSVPLELLDVATLGFLKAAFCCLAVCLSPVKSVRWLVGAVGIEPKTLSLLCPPRSLEVILARFAIRGNYPCRWPRCLYPQFRLVSAIPQMSKQEVG
jgi:hypothetical protein